MLRKLMALVLFAELGLVAVSAQSPKAGPVKVIYFYKVKWGYQQEFLDLYKRNHYPVMEAQVKTGRLLSVETHVPRFHGDGRNDWTVSFRVALT